MRKVRDKNRIKVNKFLLDEKEYKTHNNETRKLIREAPKNYYNGVPQRASKSRFHAGFLHK